MINIPVIYTAEAPSSIWLWTSKPLHMVRTSRTLWGRIFISSIHGSHISCITSSYLILCKILNLKRLFVCKFFFSTKKDKTYVWINNNNKKLKLLTLWYPKGSHH